jgi:hypothetical protein
MGFAPRGSGAPRDDGVALHFVGFTNHWIAQTNVARDTRVLSCQNAAFVVSNKTSGSVMLSFCPPTNVFIFTGFSGLPRLPENYCWLDWQGALPVLAPGGTVTVFGYVHDTAVPWTSGISYQCQGVRGGVRGKMLGTAYNVGGVPALIALDRLLPEDKWQWATFGPVTNRAPTWPYLESFKFNITRPPPSLHDPATYRFIEESSPR